MSKMTFFRFKEIILTF